MQDRRFARERHLSLTVFATLGVSCGVASWAAPQLYQQPSYESPVRASGDDLLLVPGIGLSASDTVVYQAVSDTRSVPAHPTAIPAISNASSGVADIASAADAPFSLAVHVPAVLDANQSYVIWVVDADGGWSNGVRINDARPLWITPEYAYATAAVAGLPRILKVVGRNLHPISGGTTQVRLTGPQTYTLNALNVTTDPTNTTTQLQRYVAAAPLPATLAVGTYTVQISRDGVSWTDLIGHGRGSEQSFTVKADPTTPTRFDVSDPTYGINSNPNLKRLGTPCVPGDGANDGPCILNAIYAAAHNPGGGTVYFPKGNWELLDPSIHGTFTGATGDGIVVPPNVNLQGAGSDQTTIELGTNWSAPGFTLQSFNTVSGITFHEDTEYTPTSSAQPAIRLGPASYWVNNYNPVTTHASNIIITDNVFDKPFTGIANAGLPVDHLFVTNNVFGAYQNAIILNGAGNFTTYNFSDSVVAYNTFYPSSYLNGTSGPVATQLDSGLHVDFSNNTADGTSTQYFYNQGDQKGFRAAFFFNTDVAEQEMVLISRNVALCSGDKNGDGEAIVFEPGSNELEAFPSALQVAFAQPWTDPKGGAPGTILTINGGIRTTSGGATIPDLTAYYQGYWLRVVSGTGLGQWRKAVSVNNGGTLTNVVVTPPFDVLPSLDSRVLLGRGAWQTAIVDNFIDQRTTVGQTTLCTKGNLTKPAGGAMSWYVTAADSAMEGNQQYDTSGIVLIHHYLEVDPSNAIPTTITQSFNEVRDNLIDGEYDWNSAASSSGILLGYVATADTGPPPVIGYGTSISHNAIRQADTSLGSNNAPMGAIALTPAATTGPADAHGATQWQMADSTLIFKNSLTDITGGGLSRVGIGIDAAYSTNQIAWQSVLYANSCSNVQTPLTDYGMATVRYCPTAGTTCECNGTSLDVGVSAAVNLPSAQTGDNLIYTATVTNNGSGNATGVTVAVKLPFEVGFYSLTSSQGSCDLATRVCKIGPLAAGAPATVTAQGSANYDGTDIPMTFTVTHAEADPVVTNDSATVLVKVRFND